MTWLLIATIAQIILGTSAVFDKILLKKALLDPRVYTFWLGVFGLFSFVLLPFGFISVPLPIVLLALFAGALFILAMFFLFLALSRGEVSSVLPIVGGLSPLFTFIASGIFLTGYSLDLGDFFGFFLLVVGGLIFLLIERRNLGYVILFFTILSAITLGISNVLIKIVFEQSNFITGFFWTKMGGVLFVVLLLAIPSFRNRIFFSVTAVSGPILYHKSSFVLYLANRLYASIGSVLVFSAIALAHPALVDSTQSIKYVTVFIAAWFLLHERFQGSRLFWKVSATILVSIGLAWLAIVSYAQAIPIKEFPHTTWGVTFSDKFSRQLGLDWQENLISLLYDLHPEKIRFVAYWDDIEKNHGEYDFSNLDLEMEEARIAGSKVIIALGMRVPRWPECHQPDWAYRISTEEREEALKIYMRHVVERYRTNPTLIMWQVENEPYLNFGECPLRAPDFLRDEVALVKSLDPSRPILTTDGGELGTWFNTEREGDVFGTTMYRKVFPKIIGPFFGVIEYPIGPQYFRLKEKITRAITGNENKPYIVIELQGEPWGPEEIQRLSYEDQLKYFSPEYFNETLVYAQKTGFPEYYLWGAEWWYWLREVQKDSRYWDRARVLFDHGL